MVTGSDHTHAHSLLNFIESAQIHEPGTPLTVYDLGMFDWQLAEIVDRFESVEVKRFAYEDYPAYFNIGVNAGEFAWKPTLIWEEIGHHGHPLCWMDAGNLIVKPLQHIRSELARVGFYSEQSTPSISEWTHQGMINWFELPPDWGDRRPMLNGAAVAFNPNCEEALRLAERWAQFAAIRDCIAPQGSDRTNHRQDQSLLSVLAYLDGVVEEPSRPDYRRGREFTIHNDVKDRRLRARILRRVARFRRRWQKSG